MKRYDLVLREVDQDGEYSDVVMVTGPASACLAIVPSIVEALGGPEIWAMSTPATPAAEAPGDGLARLREVAVTPAESEQAKPRARRRTKAEMQAARAAEAAGGPPAGDDDSEPEVTTPEGELASGGVVTTPVRAMPVLTGFTTPPAAPYNPFA